MIIASRPFDTDSVGSGLVIKKYLESLNKKTKLVFPTKISDQDRQRNQFIPYFEELEYQDTRELMNKEKFDVLILLDGSNIVQYYDTTQTVDDPPNLNNCPKRIHIDHHFQHPEKLGTLEIFDSKASSTMEIVLQKVIPKEFIDEKIATLGYAAIAGDTGNFRYGFRSPTFKTMAMLQKKGADVFQVLERLHLSKTKQYLEMLAYGIKNTEYDDRLKTSFLFLPYQKLKKDKIDKNEVKDIKWSFDDIYARYVPGYPLGILMYEIEPGKIKISCRGNNLTNKINLPKMFMELGGNGGGHFHAVGIDLDGKFSKIKSDLVKTIEKYRNISSLTN